MKIKHNKKSKKNKHKIRKSKKNTKKQTSGKKYKTRKLKRHVGGVTESKNHKKTKKTTQEKETRMRELLSLVPDVYDPLKDNRESIRRAFTKIPIDILKEMPNDDRNKIYNDWRLKEAQIRNEQRAYKRKYGISKQKLKTTNNIFSGEDKLVPIMEDTILNDLNISSKDLELSIMNNDGNNVGLFENYTPGTENYRPGTPLYDLDAEAASTLLKKSDSKIDLKKDSSDSDLLNFLPDYNETDI
jgi:hypothetical protein